MRFEEINSNTVVKEYAFPKKELPKLTTKGITVGFEFEYLKPLFLQGEFIPWKKVAKSHYSDALLVNNEEEFKKKYQRLFPNISNSYNLLQKIFDNKSNLIPTLAKEGFLKLEPFFKSEFEILPDGLHYLGGEIDFKFNFKKEAEVLSKFLNLDVSPRPNSQMWSLHEDGSLFSKDNDFGIELVSPPLPLNAAMKHFKDVLKYIRTHAKTNQTTGLHINISLDKNRMEKLDLFKFLLLLDNKKALKQFNRLKNQYSSPIEMDHFLHKALWNIYSSPSKYKKIDPTELKNKLIDAAMNKLHSVIKRSFSSYNFNSHYKSVDISKLKKGYLEIRIVGGKDYQKKSKIIENYILQWVKILMVSTNSKILGDTYRELVWKEIYPSLDYDLQRYLRTGR